MLARKPVLSLVFFFLIQPFSNAYSAVLFNKFKLLPSNSHVEQS
jgi:hypothetical protein